MDARDPTGKARGGLAPNHATPPSQWGKTPPGSPASVLDEDVVAFRPGPRGGEIKMVLGQGCPPIGLKNFCLGMSTTRRPPATRVLDFPPLGATPGTFIPLPTRRARSGAVKLPTSGD